MKKDFCYLCDCERDYIKKTSRVSEIINHCRVEYDRTEYVCSKCGSTYPYWDDEIQELEEISDKELIKEYNCKTNSNIKHIWELFELHHKEVTGVREEVSNMLIDIMDEYNLKYPYELCDFFTIPSLQYDVNIYEMIYRIATIHEDEYEEIKRIYSHKGTLWCYKSTQFNVENKNKSKTFKSIYKYNDIELIYYIYKLLYISYKRQKIYRNNMVEIETYDNEKIKGEVSVYTECNRYWFNIYTDENNYREIKFEDVKCITKLD